MPTIQKGNSWRNFFLTFRNNIYLCENYSFTILKNEKLKNVFLLCLLFLSLNSFSQAIDTAALVTTTNSTLATGGLITATTHRTLSLSYVRSFFNRVNDTLMKSLTFARNTGRDSIIITYTSTSGAATRLAVKDSFPPDLTDSVAAHRTELDSIPDFIHGTYINSGSAYDFAAILPDSSFEAFFGLIGIDTTMLCGGMAIEPRVFDNGSGMDNVFFTWRISANNQVAIRCINNSPTVTCDPANGKFKVMAIKK